MNFVDFHSYQFDENRLRNDFTTFVSVASTLITTRVLVRIEKIQGAVQCLIGGIYVVVVLS